MSLIGTPYLASWVTDTETVWQFDPASGTMVQYSHEYKRRTYAQDATDEADEMVSSPPAGFTLKTRGGSRESARVFHLTIDYVLDGPWSPVTPSASPSPSASGSP